MLMSSTCTSASLAQMVEDYLTVGNETCGLLDWSAALFINLAISALVPDDILAVMSF